MKAYSTAFWIFQLKVSLSLLITGVTLGVILGTSLVSGGWKLAPPPAKECETAQTDLRSPQMKELEVALADALEAGDATGASWLEEEIQELRVEESGPGQIANIERELQMLEKQMFKARDEHWSKALGRTVSPDQAAFVEKLYADGFAIAGPTKKRGQ